MEHAGDVHNERADSLAPDILITGIVKMSRKATLPAIRNNMTRMETVIFRNGSIASLRV